MYNRYVPQPDGSYRKNRVPEPARPQVQQRSPTPQKSKQDSCDPPKREISIPCPIPTAEHPVCSCPRKNQNNHESIAGFFKQLLPKDLETADLLIIILLLLVAGDCEEDRNNALLTLALYFFM